MTTGPTGPTGLTGLGEDRTAVLLAASGADWEPAALAALGGAGIAVVRRCVDLADLLAAAATGRCDVAVVSTELPGLDGSAITDLLRHDVRTVAVGDEGRISLARIGVVEVVPGEAVAALPRVVEAAARRDLVVDPAPDEHLALVPTGPPVQGRVVAVWGPTGAPGRTTVALGLAAELASRVHSSGGRVVLADLDPYSGAVAQHLGVLDEVSGVLAAARLANVGELDDRRFAATRRRASPGLELLTGLPRADRWIEVREGVTEDLLAAAARVGDVVADTGFCLETGESDLGLGGGGRNRMTLEALAVADEVVVVGAADPVGLSRLARGLVEVAETLPGAPIRVVVNRMRPRLGWEEAEIVSMIEGFVRPAGTHFLPDDPVAVDTALVSGGALTEGGASALRRALADLATAVFPDAPAPLERPRGRVALGRREGRKGGGWRLSLPTLARPTLKRRTGGAHAAPAADVSEPVEESSPLLERDPEHTGQLRLPADEPAWAPEPDDLPGDLPSDEPSDEGPGQAPKSR